MMPRISSVRTRNELLAHAKTIYSLWYGNSAPLALLETYETDNVYILPEYDQYMRYSPIGLAVKFWSGPHLIFVLRNISLIITDRVYADYKTTLMDTCPGYYFSPRIRITKCSMPLSGTQNFNVQRDTCQNPMTLYLRNMEVSATSQLFQTKIP